MTLTLASALDDGKELVGTYNTDQKVTFTKVSDTSYIFTMPEYAVTITVEDAE